MLTHGTLQTQFSEVDVTEVLASDWWRGSSENLRESSARVREWSARQEEKKRGKKKKKEGRGGWGKARKKEGGVGGVGDDVIEKIKK